MKPPAVASSSSSEHDYRKLILHFRNLLGAGAFLQADETHAVHLGQRSEGVQRDGAMAVGGVVRLPCPNRCQSRSQYSDSEDLAQSRQAAKRIAFAPSRLCARYGFIRNNSPTIRHIAGLRHVGM
jgi:hypothetical protein